MTRRWLAVAAVTVIALTACTRGGSAAGSNVTPAQTYGAGPTQGDVQSLLGSTDWWPTTPSFLVRPLDLPTLSESLRYAVLQKFVHVGTPETLTVVYQQFATTSDATTEMTSIQNQNQQVATTPKVGDQSLYYGFRSADTTSIYSMFAVVRLGVFLIKIDLDKDAGFADVSLMGKIATKLTNRLKDVIAGKAHPSPIAGADQKLMAPAGPDVTLVGSARLPIEALVASLSGGGPQQLVDVFHQAGVKDFLYGDYALDADLTMEVKTNLFTFQSPTDAMGFAAAFAGGAANLGSTGSTFNYVASAGEYIGVFAAGPYAALVYCEPTLPGQAASRACEAPFASLINAWQLSLTSQ